MGKNPVVHFEIMGKDGPKLREFYGSIFDWEFEVWDKMDYGMVAAGAEKNAIGGGVGTAPEGAGPMATFYVQVEDVQASLDKVAELGGTVVMPVTPIPDVGSCAMFLDPEGNLIGLYKGME